MIKTTGWAPVRQRLIDHTPFGHWNTQTLIAALRHDRLDAPWVIKGAINRELFDPYIETQLAPTLRCGDVVILDNLPTHKSAYAADVLLRGGLPGLLSYGFRPGSTGIRSEAVGEKSRKSASIC